MFYEIYYASLTYTGRTEWVRYVLRPMRNHWLLKPNGSRLLAAIGLPDELKTRQLALKLSKKCRTRAEVREVEPNGERKTVFFAEKGERRRGW